MTLDEFFDLIQQFEGELLVDDEMESELTWRDMTAAGLFKVRKEFFAQCGEETGRHLWGYAWSKSKIALSLTFFDQDHFTLWEVGFISPLEKQVRFSWQYFLERNQCLAKKNCLS